MGRYNHTLWNMAQLVLSNVPDHLKELFVEEVHDGQDASRQINKAGLDKADSVARAALRKHTLATIDHHFWWSPSSINGHVIWWDMDFWGWSWCRGLRKPEQRPTPWVFNFRLETTTSSENIEALPGSQYLPVSPATFPSNRSSFSGSIEAKAEAARSSSPPPPLLHHHLESHFHFPLKN